jgi:dienelactone hydrolase
LLAPHRVRLIHYHSHDEMLPAYWCTPTPSRRTAHPAVVLHAVNESLDGETGLDPTDLEDVRRLLDRDFAVLLPTYRGHGGNPGAFVAVVSPGDDGLAAVEALKRRNDVDGGRIFLFGRGSGGDAALYGARRSADVRAAVALSPRTGDAFLHHGSVRKVPVLLHVHVGPLPPGAERGANSESTEPPVPGG